MPLGRGRKLHLYAWTRDDRRTPDEHEAAVAKALKKGWPVPRRERMPDRAWWLHAALYRDESRAPAGMDRSALANWREQSWGAILKGWFRFGWSRYRFKTVELEFAVGGEDNMLQWAFKSPLVSWAFGVKIPRRWTRSWVYERREWSIHFGYIGSLARIHFAHDDHMASTGMDDYYRRKLAQGEDVGHVTKAMLWNGWGFYLGGAHVWERQVTSRIFGKRDYVRVMGDPVPVKIVMPEGPYDATVTSSVETWKRPRAWWQRRMEGVEIELEHPPMYAGKGENSWDCDDDATYSITTRKVMSPLEAAAYYREHVLEQRERYGKPSRKVEA